MGLIDFKLTDAQFRTLLNEHKQALETERQRHATLLVRLDALQAQNNANTERILEVMANNQEIINKIKANVEQGNTVQQSAITLLQNLAQQIRDAADDPTELNAIADALDSQRAALAAAVEANTPGAPPVEEGGTVARGRR